MSDLSVFLSGAIWLGYAVLGLFFLKFWRRTHDPLFLSFAIALWMLSALRIALTMFAAESEVRTFLYLGRLVAFCIILWAIFRKNRETRSGQQPLVPERP